MAAFAIGFANAVMEQHSVSYNYGKFVKAMDDLQSGNKGQKCPIYSAFIDSDDYWLRLGHTRPYDQENQE